MNYPRILIVALLGFCMAACNSRVVPMNSRSEIAPSAADRSGVALVPGIRTGLISNIQYGEAGGEKLLLDAHVPEGAGPFPMVILIHGGGWSGGDREKEFKVMFEPLSKADFTWFSIDYRLAPKNRWPACFDDLQTSIRWVKLHAADFKGDPTRLALMGYSAGGHLAFLSAATGGPDVRVQALVGFSPPTDLELDLPARGGLSPSLQNLLGMPHLLTDASRQKLHDISAINHLSKDFPPTLIVQGSADKSVPYQGSLNFIAKLKELGVAAALITIPGAGHNIALWHTFDESYKAKAVDWLRKTMGAPTTRATAG